MLNLERMPPLASKYANKIGKYCRDFTITYGAGGVQVNAASWLDRNGVEQAALRADPDEIPLIEFERRCALKNTPSNDERLSALRRKFELRLNAQFPAQGPASGSEADIQAWLGTLGFAQRRALLMSQKDFEKSFPDGFRA
jgi:hypothetical protein